MAEIIIRWTDKVATNHPNRWKALCKGDVIEVMPNGYDWAQSSLTNPAWRIIKLPNVSESVITFLLGRLDDPVTGAQKARRKNFLDSTKMNAAARNQINNNQVSTFNIAGADLLNWITQRT